MNIFKLKITFKINHIHFKNKINKIVKYYANSKILKYDLENTYIIPSLFRDFIIEESSEYIDEYSMYRNEKPEIKQKMLEEFLSKAYVAYIKTILNIEKNGNYTNADEIADSDYWYSLRISITEEDLITEKGV